MKTHEINLINFIHKMLQHFIKKCAWDKQTLINMKMSPIYKRNGDMLHFTYSKCILLLGFLKTR